VGGRAQMEGGAGGPYAPRGRADSFLACSSSRRTHSVRRVLLDAYGGSMAAAGVAGGRVGGSAPGCGHAPGAGDEGRNTQARDAAAPLPLAEGSRRGHMWQWAEQGRARWGE
jgi:hypothetical protein